MQKAVKNMEGLGMIWNIAEGCVEAASPEHGEAFQYGIFLKHFRMMSLQ